MPIMIMILTFLLLQLTLSFENQLQSQVIIRQTIGTFLNSSLSPFHKFSVSIKDIFSGTSDISVVITSCNRFHLLEQTLNSFFHYNTYVVREMIIIQDCGGNIDKLWSLLPSGAQKYSQYFNVLKNPEKLGQIGSIDKAYSLVKSKYVYHLQDDWLHLGSYGFLQKMKDCLEHAQKNKVLVSQVVQTYQLWSWTHQLSMLYRTQHKTKYYLISSYGKDYLYSFSFNPHLINYEQIYKKVLNSSYINSIAKRFHCPGMDKQGEIMKDGGCVEHETGKYLERVGYKQAYVQIRNKNLFQHIGIKEGEQTPESKIINFEIKQLINEQKENDKDQISEKGDTQKAIEEERTTKEIEKQKVDIQKTNFQQNKQKDKTEEYINMLKNVVVLALISITAYAIFSQVLKLKSLRTKSQGRQTRKSRVRPKADLEEQQFSNADND